MAYKKLNRICIYTNELHKKLFIAHAYTMLQSKTVTGKEIIEDFYSQLTDEEQKFLIMIFCKMKLDERNNNWGGSQLGKTIIKRFFDKMGDKDKAKLIANYDKMSDEERMMPSKL